MPEVDWGVAGWPRLEGAGLPVGESSQESHKLP
jgi:hypothetical protein